MKAPAKTYFNWSSGKDAAMALYRMQRSDEFSIELLLTSVNTHHDRVSMHGLQRSLLEQQIQSIGIPFTTIELPEESSMDDYNAIMKAKVEELTSKNFTHTAFGDIFLEDLRAYREEQLKIHEIQCIFPLWKEKTKDLLKEFIDLGFKAIVICTKAELLGEAFIGREIDHSFINDLPENVDPCGENGEFHTFCYDGPIFSSPVQFNIGDKVYRSYKNPDQNAMNDSIGFWFCDLLPVNN